MKGSITDRCFEWVRDAAAAAYANHGELSQDPVRACAIMVREAGEALNEALLATVPGVPDTERNRKLLALHDELAQVAATAMVIMDRLRRNGDKSRA